MFDTMFIPNSLIPFNLLVNICAFPIINKWY